MFDPFCVSSKKKSWGRPPDPPLKNLGRHTKIAPISVSTLLGRPPSKNFKPFAPANYLSKIKVNILQNYLTLRFAPFCVSFSKIFRGRTRGPPPLKNFAKFQLINGITSVFCISQNYSKPHLI